MDLVCETCHQRFSRREHLERHLRRHSGIRPFPCPLCSRSFSRRDTLARHITTHGARAEGLFVRARSASACLPCSRAKLKCNGGDPCGRCQSKGRNCVYRSFGQIRSPSPAIPDETTPIRDHSVTGSDTAELGTAPPNLRLNPVPMSSGQEDMIDVLAVGNRTPRISDTDFSFPWMLDYTNFFQDDPPGDQFDPATQFPFSPLASNSTPANDQRYNRDILNFSDPQEHQPSRVQNPSRPSTADATDEDTIIAENFCHVRVPMDKPYRAILEFSNRQLDVGFKEVPFPSQSAFESFIQLYYEYFDCKLSFIHRSILEHRDTPWLLVLAVASVGSQYTQLSKREQYSVMLTELLRLSLPLDVRLEPPHSGRNPNSNLLTGLQAHKARGYDTRVLAQCSLLAMVNLMFTGFKDNVINLQVQRAWLAALVRPFLTSSKRQSSLLCQEVNYDIPSDRWSMWICSETERRLAYCFLVVDSFCFIFLGMPMTFTATDYQQILPSSEALWRARNADEWRALLTLHVPEAHSLKELFVGPVSTLKASQTSDLSNLCQHLMLFTEEQRVQAASRSWILHDLSSGDLHHQPCPQKSSFGCLDWRYQMLVPPSSAAPSLIANVSDMRKTFFHLLFILRYLPLEKLYTYSGWYASEDDITSARSYLRTWLQNNPELSRECVSHAGALIGKIRSFPTLSCYDPFSLLISVMFLWAFERLKPDSPVAPEESLQDREPAIIFRIDQCDEETIRERWLRGDPRVLVHITGVGLLSSTGGTRRLLQEFLRIIKSRTGWPTLCRGLAVCVRELMDGVAPITTSPHSDHGT
ncbi:hypothetical protein ASPFODRAFT_46576 [Aspergillus luchuensis CBS 106.47]|uniref:C2H2 type zinc finger domain protein n=1 Tax=Aspergillus luchuensis (strain CBS 106.47) TaxID=1137211 RepID=A0A1M3TFK4_ASPLC|nr:hypothetical protein ASPFODRAFT_46576 [Aspergillus luchuensis CBS 106.47]